MRANSKIRCFERSPFRYSCCTDYYFLVVLLILALLPWGLASVPVYAPILSKVCGLDQVDYLGLPGEQHLSINGRRIEDPFLICEALETYFENGCFACDSNLETWGMLGEKYCNQDLHAATHAKCNTLPVAVHLLKQGPRKILLQISENVSNLNQSSKMGMQEEEYKFSSEQQSISLAVPGMLLLCCGILCPCFHAKRKDESNHNVLEQQNSMDLASSLEFSTTTEKIPATPRIPPSPSRFSLSPQLCRIGSVHLSVNQIMKATHNFSSSLKLGEGGFGTVYKATLPDGQVVAVKRAKKEQISSLRDDEFSNEVELLAKIEHRSLVRLLGYTDRGNERIIITEYVPNGTLREHLDGLYGKILDFNQRLGIAIDVAHALTYLHLYAEKTIIHRDVKSSNILLTESYRAKVSDFGFARSGPSDADKTHISTKVKGTAGYLDPEYLRTYQLTPKSDVFSFGILLIEIISGRRPVDLKKVADERITVRWAFRKHNEGSVSDILDPLLEEKVDEEIAGKMLNLAFECAAPTRADRPAMKEVGERLWEIRKEYGKSQRSV